MEYSACIDLADARAAIETRRSNRVSASRPSEDSGKSSASIWNIRSSALMLIIVWSGLLMSCAKERSDLDLSRDSEAGAETHTNTDTNTVNKPSAEATRLRSGQEEEDKSLSSEDLTQSEGSVADTDVYADTDAQLSGAASLAISQLGSEEIAYYEDLNSRVKTIIPPDGIPSIDTPRFWTAEEASAHYREDERVIGIDLEGEQRAYSVPHLSAHEIVNDSLGGRPFSVTW